MTMKSTIDFTYLLPLSVQEDLNIFDNLLKILKRMCVCVNCAAIRIYYPTKYFFMFLFKYVFRCV